MVSSWDLFRTLVDARNGKAGEDTIENHYPIKENVDQVRRGDVVVSDYETHRSEKAQQIVERIGLDNLVIVTDGGKHEGWVWEKLKTNFGLSIAKHTGDHLRSDVESPQACGIEGAQCSQHLTTAAEAKVAELGFPILSRVMHEARLRTFNQAYRGIELLQVNYNFPVLFLASIVLNRRYPDHSLLMSSRDCYMWQGLMAKLFGRGIYWYTSCIARINADANYHRYIQQFGNPLLVDLCGSGISFSKLPQYPSVLLFKPNDSPEKTIPSLVCDKPVFRLEQANLAPHQKCKGVDANLKPIFINRGGYDWEREPHVDAQLHAFRVAMMVMDLYDLTAELNASDEQCIAAMKWLLPHYIDFAADVEDLRLMAIADDQGA